MGADALKLLIYYHPDAANAAAAGALSCEVAEACADVDLPLYLETLGYSIDEPAPSSPARRGATSWWGLRGV